MKHGFQTRPYPHITLIMEEIAIVRPDVCKTRRNSAASIKNANMAPTNDRPSVCAAVIGLSKANPCLVLDRVVPAPNERGTDKFKTISKISGASKHEP